MGANEAAKWLRQMVQVALKPNVVSYSATIKAFAKAGDVENVSRILNRMQAEQVLPNIVTWTSLIDACAKARPRRCAEAEIWFRVMLAQCVIPDQMAIRTLMRAIGHQSAILLCEELGVSS